MELGILVSCFFEFTKNFVYSCEILLLEIVTIRKKWYNAKETKILFLWENNRYL